MIFKALSFKRIHFVYFTIEFYDKNSNFVLAYMKVFLDGESNKEELKF